MRQIKMSSIGKSPQQGRSCQRLSQRDLKRHHPSHQIINAEPRKRDEAALVALRQSIARSLMEIGESVAGPGQMPHFTLSRDGYRVYRIGIGGAEILMAIKEGEQGTQMKYIYFDGSPGEPEMWSGECRDALDVAASGAVVK